MTSMFAHESCGFSHWGGETGLMTTRQRNWKGQLNEQGSMSEESVAFSPSKEPACLTPETWLVSCLLTSGLVHCPHFTGGTYVKDSTVLWPIPRRGKQGLRDQTWLFL